MTFQKAQEIIETEYPQYKTQIRIENLELLSRLTEAQFRRLLYGHVIFEIELGEAISKYLRFTPN